MIYWRLKRRFSGAALLFSLIAYFGAIIVKEIVQYATYKPLLASPYHGDVALGLYFGLQTVFFEVGGAYLIARVAISRAKMKAEDADGYGIGLAFWENGVLLGALTLVNLISDYAILSLGSGSSVAQLVYNALATSTPSYFDPPIKALPLIGFGFMERVSSLLFHFSWGYLCLLAAAFKRRHLFFVALPMGLLDFLVPFASVIGIALFETILSVLGISVTLLTWQITKDLRTRMRAQTPSVQPEGNARTSQ